MHVPVLNSTFVCICFISFSQVAEVPMSEPSDRDVFLEVVSGDFLAAISWYFNVVLLTDLKNSSIEFVTIGVFSFSGISVLWIFPFPVFCSFEWFAYVCLSLLLLFFLSFDQKYCSFFIDILSLKDLS